MKNAVDFGSRFVFFATAPLVLVFLALLFPMTGALVQVALMLVGFFFAEGVRDLAARSRLAKLVLSSQLAFEEHYRKHPPRPFLYYAFYPLLFPYWLSDRDARREFLLYNGYTLATLGLLVLSLVVQYVWSFPPELTLEDFAPIAAGTLAVQTGVVLMFLMPIVTTVVHYHLTRQPGRLVVLLLAAIVPLAVAAWRVERRRDPVVSYATRARVRLRAAAEPAHARKAEAQALNAAWTALPANKADIDSDGKVEGEPLDRAHETLESFYKHDEAYAFDLWYTKRGKSATMVIYFEARGRHPPIWLGMDRSRTPFDDVGHLPRGAFGAMRKATE